MALAKTIVLTLVALLAFAANSVLCRLALGDGTIDAASFTVVRLLSAVVVLTIILAITTKKASLPSSGSWLSAAMLFLYAVAFSFAYVSLDTATGALVLFATVQATMILGSVISGNRLHLSEWLGLLIAFSGFVVLVLPGATVPSFSAFGLMFVAGLAWGIYTLRGRASKFPLADTAFNFARTIPLVLLLALISIPTLHLSSEGVALAVMSGGLASGLGYMVWYLVLGSLSVTVAAVVQLAVPLLAAIGGVLFVSEVISARLVLSSVMILGGILVVVLGRNYFINRTEVT